MDKLTRELSDFLTQALHPREQSTRKLPAYHRWQLALAELTVPASEQGRQCQASFVPTYLEAVASEAVAKSVAEQLTYREPTIEEGMKIIAEYATKARF
jgi:hypothetical protein